ncbi:MAG TPA: hypothetical protein DCE41_36170 [Cytophagales bacterium]|nr:hypothetical protein [Cytophagales bacterium]HAA18744.1 hypothetical protein [Cytophagales bacterium]HAP63140.1 hypothetical protein [Cytophagales bacterium]
MKKGKRLLQAGQICTVYIFVRSGALRLYHKRQNKEYTAWIATEGQVFTELDSYLFQKPTQIWIEAIEDAEVLLISKAESDELAKKSFAYNTLLRRTVEESFAFMSRNIIAFQSATAEERYRTLEEEKNWLMYFPMKYLHSFFGVTQSTFSRIRGRKA